jgi:hypothetical protein
MTTLMLIEPGCFEGLDLRDTFLPELGSIEQASPGLHRLVFVQPHTQLERDPDEPDCFYRPRIVARWVMTETFLCSLLTIIPQYLDLCERGEDYPSRPEIVFNDRVVPFRKAQ